MIPEIKTDKKFEKNYEKIEGTKSRETA